MNGFYGSAAAEKRQRGGRKKRKKNHQEERIVVQNWDDIYDPSRPNNYEDYKHSDEKWAEIREWKDRLYAHRYAREKAEEDREMDSDGSEMEERRAARNSECCWAEYEDGTLTIMEACSRRQLVPTLLLRLRLSITTTNKHARRLPRHDLLHRLQ